MSGAFELLLASWRRAVGHGHDYDSELFSSPRERRGASGVATHTRQLAGTPAAGRRLGGACASCRLIVVGSRRQLRRAGRGSARAPPPPGARRHPSRAILLLLLMLPPSLSSLSS
jgi:hypothetical protein